MDGRIPDPVRKKEVPEMARVLEVQDRPAEVAEELIAVAAPEPGRYRTAPRLLRLDQVSEGVVHVVQHRRYRSISRTSGMQ